MQSLTYAQKLKSDIPASLAVFLVAIPLCLGIAHASGTPLLSGLISGVVGGIVVGLLSDSQLSVSGPAAGLITVMLGSIKDLGSYQQVCVALILAGLIQIILGIVKMGKLTRFLPFSVVEGMMAGIGAILIMKQAHFLIGQDSSHSYHIQAAVIGTISMISLLMWDHTVGKKIKIIPASLVVVILSLLINYLFHIFFAPYEFGSDYLVNLPLFSGISDVSSKLMSPDWSAFNNPTTFKVAITICLIASIESLLSINATERLDPYHRHTNKNRELYAQGAGNILCGLLGGLPITSVIVRSSVNLSAGAKSRYSAILHGLFILLAMIWGASIINKIPIVALSSILVFTGYKLANPKIFYILWKKGRLEFASFLITFLLVVFEDLLVGVMVGVFFNTIIENYFKGKEKKVEDIH